MTHICISKLTIIDSDNGLSPGQCQAIIRTNAGILSIRTMGTNFSEILSKIHTFSFKKVHLKMSSGKLGPFCVGLHVLREHRANGGHQTMGVASNTFCCFAVLCCGYTLTDFPISIRLTSLALWQSNDCPSASKTTLMNMDKYFMWIHYER